MFRSFGVDRYVAGESDCYAGPDGTTTRDRTPVVFCHASGSSAEIVMAGGGNVRALALALADYYPTGIADLGGETWGNDTGITRIGQQLDYLASTWGATRPAILIGCSMGALNALAFTLAQPHRVAAVAAVIPALDLASLHADVTFTALINAAYGGAYNDGVHGPTHSPVQFAASLPARLPIGLFTSSNDPYCLPATAAAFMAARPNTYRENLGAVSHSVPGAAALVSSWIRSTYK